MGGVQWGVCIALGLGWVCATAGPTGGEDSLRVQLDEIAAGLDRGECDRAGDSLTALLEQEGLRARLVGSAEADEVRELLLRCAFGLSYRPPEVAGLLGVESAVWNRRSGRLEVSFDGTSVRHEDASTGLAEVASVYGFHPRGFTLVDGVLFFDVPFSGPCRLAVEGRLPAHKNDRKRSPQLVLRVDDRLSYTVDYTWPSTWRKSRGLWSQGTIHQWTAGVSELLTTDRTPGGKYDMMWGERYDLKLVVKSSALSASLQGRGMCSVRKERRAYGQLGLRWCPSINRLSLSGIVDREVIERLRAEHHERAFAGYAASEAAREHIPAWLQPEQQP